MFHDDSIKLGEQRVNVVIEGTTVGAELQRTRGSLKQARPKFRLELFDLVADGRGCQEQDFCGLPKTLVLRGRAEDPHCPQRNVAICFAHTHLMLHFSCQPTLAAGFRKVLSQQSLTVYRAKIAGMFRANLVRATSGATRYEATAKASRVKFSRPLTRTRTLSSIRMPPKGRNQSTVDQLT